MSRLLLDTHVWLWGDALDDEGRWMPYPPRRARARDRCHARPTLREACWHDGKISDDQWAPHFTSVTVGEALRAVMERHPHRTMEVLCGHTHGAGTAQVLPNLVVRTGAAEYGAPSIAAVLTTG